MAPTCTAITARESRCAIRCFNVSGRGTVSSLNSRLSFVNATDVPGEQQSFFSSPSAFSSARKAKASLGLSVRTVKRSSNQASRVGTRTRPSVDLEDL